MFNAGPMAFLPNRIFTVIQCSSMVRVVGFPPSRTIGGEVTGGLHPEQASSVSSQTGILNHFQEIC